MPIIDFDLKQKLTFALLNVGGVPQLVEKVSRAMGFNYDADQMERIGDAWRTWKKGNPEQQEKLDFLQGMVRLLPLETTDLNAHMFINLRYRDLYQMVPRDLRGSLTVPPGGAEALDDDVAAKYVTVLVRRGVDLKDIEESIREDSQIDHRHLYLSEESATRWYAFLHDEDYRQYGECVSSLRNLLASPKWLTESDRIDGVVMLGAGTESKDRIVVSHLHRRFLATKRTYNYYIVDYSYHMLMPTVRGLERYISSSASGVILRRPIIANFCQLPREFPRETDEERLAWFLPGGTLGNLIEDHFFTSMSGVMREGDILVVGVETTGDDLAAFEKKLRAKYDTEVLRKFVSTPIRTYWSMKDMYFDLAAAIKGAKVDIVKGATTEKHLHNHSTVPGAVSVAIWVPVDKRRVTVLFSPRYDRQKLIDYVTDERFGFTFLDEFPDKDSSEHYKQFVFARLPGERAASKKEKSAG
jgi:hypothetical protein